MKSPQNKWRTLLPMACGWSRRESSWMFCCKTTL